MRTIDEGEEEETICFAESNQGSLTYESRFQEDFELVGLIGRGAFGRVFEARKNIDQKHYAVKRIKLPADKNARTKVMREVTVLSALNHSNIVRYFHAWREFPPSGWQEMQDANDPAKLVSSADSDGYRGDILDATSSNETMDRITPSSPSFASIFGDQSPDRKNRNPAVIPDDLTTPKNTLNRNCIQYLYIQMELCRKESLAQWLLDTRHPGQDIYKMYREILQSVAYLHSKGLIHRDLKPSNIFFAVDGTIKVGDLGLVKDMMLQNNTVQDEELPSITIDRPCKNHTGQIGTRLYMSPEQMTCKPYNHKVDVYALAIILFELLAEFSTDSERARVIPELKTSFRFPSNFKGLYGAGMEQLIVDMLSIDPDKRPEVNDILLDPRFRAKLDSTSRKAKITLLKTNSKARSLVKPKYYKLLVIGDQNTGKTSIIHRYVHGCFRERYEVTVGAAINLKEISWNDRDKLTLEFFDIGGEERSRFMTSAFYRKAVGAFVVTDVTQINGFQAATSWKKDLDVKLRMHDDSLVQSVLLINKCDGAVDGQTQPSIELDPAEIDRYCRSHRFSGWFDTSAKDDINIEEAVQFLVGRVLASERNQTHVADDDDNPIISLTIKGNHKRRSSCC